VIFLSPSRQIPGKNLKISAVSLPPTVSNSLFTIHCHLMLAGREASLKNKPPNKEIIIDKGVEFEGFTYKKLCN
jgi:hypothetical protein